MVSFLSLQDTTKPGYPQGSGWLPFRRNGKWIAGPSSLHWNVLHSFWVALEKAISSIQHKEEMRVRFISEPSLRGWVLFGKDFNNQYLHDARKEHFCSPPLVKSRVSLTPPLQWSTSVHTLTKVRFFFFFPLLSRSHPNSLSFFFWINYKKSPQL